MEDGSALSSVLDSADPSSIASPVPSPLTEETVRPGASEAGLILQRSIVTRPLSELVVHFSSSEMYR